MKFVTDQFPEGDDEIQVECIKCTYLCKPDCVSGEEDYQELTLETRDGGGGIFINIKTNENGWSISDEGDLVEIIKHFKEKIK